MPRARRPLILAFVGLLLVLALVITARANAGLIPPAGPWPAPTTATNPLVGTPYILNGGNATAFDVALRIWIPDRGRRRTTVTRTLGRRTVIRGSLHNDENGRAISGATVTIVAQWVGGGDWVAQANVRTSRRGQYRAVLPPGHHRRVAAVYFPAVGSTIPVYSRRVLVRAATRVWLGRPFQKRRSVRFDGHVSGGGGGLVVALQVRNSTGRWVTTRHGLTRASGRFRIRAALPPGRWRVRMLVPNQTGLSTYAGRSRSRTVRVR